MINPNVARLKLPRHLRKLHPSFNVDLLSHYVTNPQEFEGRPIPKASPIILNENNEQLHIIERLLRKRQFNRKPEWLVKWHNLPDHESTWELEKNINKVSHWRSLVKDFQNRQREFKSGGMS
jgi:hypothetical protein